MSCDPDGDIETLLRATRVTQVPDSISSQISFGPLGPALHFPDDGVGDVELRTPPEGGSLCGDWRDSIVPLELKRKGVSLLCALGSKPGTLSLYAFPVISFPGILEAPPVFPHPPGSRFVGNVLPQNSA